MLVEIDKIVVQDRIRKDFGDIEELAQDIKENGLINPPVVLPADEDGMYTLLAGERRLRALKSLGKTDTEVRVMSVRDGYQALKIEISENEMRKDFNMRERIEWARKIEEQENREAKKRQGTRTDLNPDIQPISAESLGQARDIAAKAVGIGRTKYNQGKTIIDHEDLFTEEEFRNWDEGKLSTNKAYQMVKARLKELEAENEELKSREPEVVEVEVAVTPPDYDKAKEEAARAKRDVADYKRLYDDMAKKWKAASAEARKLKEQMEAPDVKEAEHIRQSALSFNAGIANFLERYGGYVWLMHYIDQIPQYERDGFMRGIDALDAWIGQMKINFNPNGLEFE